MSMSKCCKSNFLSLSLSLSLLSIFYVFDPFGFGLKKELGFWGFRI